MGSFSTKKLLCKVSSGFTIIELMVTVTIVVLVTGIIMIQYSSFNSSVLLTSEAYLMAFDFREAQSLAVSVRGHTSSDSLEKFREEYGIYFDITSATPNNYLLFQDNNDNGDQTPVRYQAGEEIGVPYVISPQFSLINICATSGNSRTCYTDDPSTVGEIIDPTLHDIAVSFQRPDFDASFYSASKSNIQSVEIILGSSNSTLTKKVTIYTTGQISIK